MPMIQAGDAKKIREYLEKNLAGPVALEYFTQKESAEGLPVQECQLCKHTDQLLGEVAALSEQITLNTYDLVADEARAREQGFDRVPAFSLTGAARGKVRFIGIPSGYEFSTLIEDLVDVAAGTTDLSPSAREEVVALQKDIHIQVFSTPT